MNNTGRSVGGLLDAAQVSEDDGFRSSFIREMVQANPKADSLDRRPTVPWVIVQFWHDSSAVPADVRDCLESWAPLERQGFKRRLFDDITAGRFISRYFGRSHAAAFNRCRHPAMRCDYFRLCYILRFGGFYVDADDVYQGGDCEALLLDNRLKVHPLCYDTSTASMVDSEVFLMGGACSEDWIYYVNNNPQIAPASHPVVRLALSRATRILLSSRKVEPQDIQSTTGPGNLTASLVRHAISARNRGQRKDFCLLTDWDDVSVSRWPLSYRNDHRNWRLWGSTQ